MDNMLKEKGEELAKNVGIKLFDWLKTQPLIKQIIYGIITLLITGGFYFGRLELKKKVVNLII